MGRLRSLGVATALAAVALMTMSAAAPAQAKDGACQRAKSKTVAENRFARVYTRSYESIDDNMEDGGRALIGCWKRTGRGRRLARSYGDGMWIGGSFGLVRLHGRYVALYTDEYDVSCRYGCEEHVSRRRRLWRFDLRNRTRFRVAVDDAPAGDQLLLDARGAIAWARWLPANQIEVRVRDDSGERAVDSGAIHPESMSLSPYGLLRWSNEYGREVQLTHTMAAHA